MVKRGTMTRQTFLLMPRWMPGFPGNSPEGLGNEQ